jgi:acyl phosphate:glycerol-3-phosphate acyltransferase
MRGDHILLALLVGYLFGSIPVGYLICRLKGIDIRQVGSGRTGGTNVYRAVGILPAALTVLGDAVKAIVAIAIVRFFFASEAAAVFAGVGAVAGHNWSLFLGWRGGAGGVTAVAALLILSPLAGSVVTVCALAALLAWRYASVASLTVALLSPIVLALLGFLDQSWVHLWYGLLAGMMIVYALRPNIARLIAGTERRIELS